MFALDTFGTLMYIIGYLSDKSAIEFNFYPTGYHFVGLQFWIYSGLSPYNFIILQGYNRSRYYNCSPATKEDYSPRNKQITILGYHKITAS